MKNTILGTGLLVLATASLAACSAGPDNPNNSTVEPGGSNGDNNMGNIGDDPNNVDAEPQLTALDDRVLDYNEALRTASLKLTDALPTLTSIKLVRDAEDQRTTYEGLIDALIDDPRFQGRMVRWWRDTFRQGGGELDSAPVFAARITAEGRPFSELFTATENNCPSYDDDNEVFVDGECNNGVPVQAGVLTNPGAMKQFYGNMAFRRVRWIQEVFACQKFPAEYRDQPVDMGNAQYTSPWDFESISNSPVEFQDTESVVCANCHTSMNHLAPLFANFDADGMWQDTIQVETPSEAGGTTELSHWLAEGEVTAWRMGQEVADLPALGQAMAEDPAIAECMVARLWNFTMSKEDIVSALATIPTAVIANHIDAFNANGMSIKETLRNMLKSDDFVRF